jgi:hypothetical protein
MHPRAAYLHGACAGADVNIRGRTDGHERPQALGLQGASAVVLDVDLINGRCVSLFVDVAQARAALAVSIVNLLTGT